MKKPLISDEMLEQLERDRRLARTPVKFGYYAPDEERAAHEPSASFEEFAAQSGWDETYHGYQEGQTIRIPVEPSLVESRRIESVKKEAFSAKLNKILFWIVVLLILFLVAVFYW